MFEDTTLSQMRSGDKKEVHAHCLKREGLVWGVQMFRENTNSLPQTWGIQTIVKLT
jgi:hypothetical protein